MARDYLLYLSFSFFIRLENEAKFVSPYYYYFVGRIVGYSTRTRARTEKKRKKKKKLNLEIPVYSGSLALLCFALLCFALLCFALLSRSLSVRFNLRNGDRSSGGSTTYSSIACMLWQVEHHPSIQPASQLFL